MHVIIKSRTTFTTGDYQNVSNIAFSDGVYSLTLEGGTIRTYNAVDYFIFIVAV